MKITERLNVLRELMKEKKIDAYLVPTDDFHGSEYVGDYFKCRKYITGFTGSAGTAVTMSPEVVEPILENVKIYNEKQEVFHDLYYSVKKLYPRIV